MDFLDWCKKYCGQLPKKTYTHLNDLTSAFIREASPALADHLAARQSFHYSVDLIDGPVAIQANIDGVHYTCSIPRDLISEYCLQAMNATLTNLEKEYYQ